MEKNAKKTNKKPFLVAGFALLLALIGCVGGVTYSKYVSNTSIPSTQATVAKWGYVVTGNSENLFGVKYAKNAATNTASISSSGDVVVSASASNVVAPGTTGSMTVTVNGFAEVKAELLVTVSNISDVTLSDATTPTANTYNPLKWTVTATGETDPVASGTLEQVKSTLKDKKFALAASSSDVNFVLTFTYTWDFEKTGSEATTKLLNDEGTAISSDAADTILGLKAAEADLSDTNHEYNYANAWSASTTVGFTLTASLAQVQ